jgi:hypothetical protein
VRNIERFQRTAEEMRVGKRVFGNVTLYRGFVSDNNNKTWALLFASLANIPGTRRTHTIMT